MTPELWQQGVVVIIREAVVVIRVAMPDPAAEATPAEQEAVSIQSIQLQAVQILLEPHQIPTVAP